MALTFIKVRFVPMRKGTILKTEASTLGTHYRSVLPMLHQLSFLKDF